METDILDPPRAFGTPLFNAVLKKTASDFQVYEHLTIDLAGSGEHLYLQIEKTSMNTDEVVSILQTVYSVQSADIGLCGLKDRHAVATQWFSVKTPNNTSPFEQAAMQFNETQASDQQLLAREAKGNDAYCKCMRLISHKRHQRKLRHGAHSANSFRLCLRSLTFVNEESEAQGRQMVEQRIQRLASSGFPAFIGPQRFGFGAQNLHRARQWFASPRKRISRQKRSLYLSVARSAVYNTVLAQRVRDGSWQHLLGGEPAVLSGSRSFFIPDEGQTQAAQAHGAEAQTIDQRLREFDVHPSVPWWGRGATVAKDACAIYEADILAPLASLQHGLERAGLSQERRAARAKASELAYEWLAPDSLELCFSLAPGVFATTLVHQLGCITE